MKRGFHFHGLRRKRLSLFSICIMSTTIIILSWEKTPSLTALLPPYPDMLLPSEILSSWSIDEDSEELEDGENNGLPILSSLTKTEAKKNNEIEFEEDKTSEEDRTDFVMDTPQNGPLIKGEDANFGNNATDIEEIMSSLSDEEAKDLLEDGEIKSVPALSSDQTKTITKRNENDGNKTSETEKQGTYEAKGSQEENRSFISGEDTNNGNNTTENEEILTSLSVEEAKVDLIQDGKIHGSPIVINIETRRNEIDGEKILEQENETTNFITESPQNGSSTSGEDASNWNDATKSKDCNYAKGKWVVDNDRPLYSGFGCKRWLSGMWACRLTQRTDFDYENLRWQPKDCHLEEFQASKFLRRLQNKTLAFVGDSLGRQQFQSLMCMITEGEDTNDVQDIGNEYGLVLHEGATHPHGWAYHFSSTNTTILYYWSSTLCETEPIDPNNPEAGIAMHLDRPTPFLREYLHKLDVLVLNTGHHWNRGKLRANKWVMHVGGVPNNDKNLAVIWHAKNLTVHSVVRWLNSELPKYPNLKVFYRTISPRHFVGGDWDTGGSCNNTKPMSVGKEILLEDSMDRAAASAVKGTGVKLLDITAISQLRDEGHISRFRITINSGVQDCLHWCLPGVPDTWNELLFAQI